MTTPNVPELPGAASTLAPDAPSLYDVLHGHIDEVIVEWKRLAAAPPWETLTPARLVDALPELLPRLFRLAERGAPHVDEELSGFIAQRHGFWRRDDGIPLDAVAEEWSLLKQASRTVLARYWAEEARVHAGVARLDALIDDAVGYSLRGYYGPELDILRGRGLERREGREDRRRGGGDRRQS